MFLSCTDKPLRDREYTNLLKHYHNSLSNIVRKLGSDPEKLFTFEDLECQLKKFGKMAFVIGPLCLQLTLVNPKDVSNLDDVINRSDEKVDFITGFDPETQIEYDKRINDLFTDLLAFDYYWK